MALRPAARACDLPLDPYVVAVPANRAQFDGWVNASGSSKAGGSIAPTGDSQIGYIKVNAGETVPWELYWDPTNGGQNTKQLKIVEGVPPAKANFKIRPGKTVNLFSLADASTILIAGLGGKPMKLEEVYNRDPASTGPWSTEKYRASSPWEIPAGNYIWNPEAPVKFVPIIELGAGTSKVSAIVPVASSTPADRYQFLADCFGPNFNAEQESVHPSYKRPPAGTAGYFWKVSDGSTAGTKRPEWTGQGGQWIFKGVNGYWKVDTEDTALLPGVVKNNPAGQANNGTELNFAYNTPSAPYFYRMKPTGELTFELVSNGDKYEWFEERVQVDATGNITPTGTIEAHSLTARGDIKKQGAKYDGGVPTAVLVEDDKRPFHVHLKAGAAGTAVMGEKPGGSASFTVVDNNPYGATTASDPQPVAAPATGSLYNPANHTADFYYSMPVSDFGLSTLSKLSPPVSTDFNVSQPSAFFPFPMEKWLWFKKTGLVPTTFHKPFADGSGTEGAAPNTIFGNGASPYFSMVTYTVDLSSSYEKVTGIHHNESSLDTPVYADALPGPVADAAKSYLKGSDKRMKFFLAPKDGSGYAAFTSTSDYDSSAADSPSAGKEPVAASPEKAIFNNAFAKVAPAAVPAINYQPAVSALASNCAAPACDSSSIGQFGTVDTITDNQRVKLILLVKDTKFNRTYIFNDNTQGEWKHASAGTMITGGAMPGRVSMPDNESILPFIGTNDPEVIEFKDGGGDAAAATEFPAQVADGWSPFDRASGRRSGLWVDEDTTLVFRFVSWDNLNWQNQLNPSDFNWEINDGPKGGMVPKGDLPLDTENRFQYTFRDPNTGPDKIAADCTLTVSGPTSMSPTMQRKIQLKFFVLSNKLKILTLEESRTNK